jgi:hypothetical protein
MQKGKRRNRSHQIDREALNFCADVMWEMFSKECRDKGKIEQFLSIKTLQHRVLEGMAGEELATETPAVGNLLS